MPLPSIDWSRVYDDIHATKVSREVIFRRAQASGSGASYPTDKRIQAGVDYRTSGFDVDAGVLLPRDEIRLLIWLRDWFSRSTDGATDAELSGLVADLKGEVQETKAEFYGRFAFDGGEFKYASHQFDHRPDGKIYAIIVRLQATQ